MSFSGCAATISAADVRAVGEGQTDLGGVGDDVEAGQDGAVDVTTTPLPIPPPGPASPLAAGSFVSIRTSDGCTAR